MSGRTRIHDIVDMRVFSKSDAQGGLPPVELAGMKDGWQKIAWNKTDNAVILRYHRRLYATASSGEKKLIGVVSAKTSIDD